MILTWKHADLSNEELFWKFLVPFLYKLILYLLALKGNL